MSHWRICNVSLYLYDKITQRNQLIHLCVVCECFFSSFLSFVSLIRVCADWKTTVHVGMILRQLYTHIVRNTCNMRWVTTNEQKTNRLFRCNILKLTLIIEMHINFFSCAILLVFISYCADVVGAFQSAIEYNSYGIAHRKTSIAYRTQFHSSNKANRNVNTIRTNNKNCDLKHVIKMAFNIWNAISKMADFSLNIYANIRPKRHFKK